MASTPRDGSKLAARRVARAPSPFARPKPPAMPPCCAARAAFRPPSRAGGAVGATPRPLKVSTFHAEAIAHVRRGRHYLGAMAGARPFPVPIKAICNSLRRICTASWPANPRATSGAGDRATPIFDNSVSSFSEARTSPLGAARGVPAGISAPRTVQYRAMAARWVLLLLACAAGAWAGDPAAEEQTSTQESTTPTSTTVAPPPPPPMIFTKVRVLGGE